MFLTLTVFVNYLNSMIFRSRDDQLKVFLRQLHPFLQRQELEYGIYIINQVWHIDKRQETRTRIRDIYYKSGVAYRQETRDKN